VTTIPAASEILSSLATVANGATTLAIVWHVLVFVAFVAVAAGFRPSVRVLAWMSVLPLLSVSVVAYWHEALFNCVVFAAITAGLVFLSPRGEDEKVHRGPAWAVVLGSMLLAFAWTYPHFLAPERSQFAYVYAAPMGLIPCPTLALVAGVTLVTGASTGTRSAVLVAIASLFYGLVGMVKLGVDIDAVLVAGSIGLIALALGRSTSTPRVGTERADARMAR
jgi:hypothetical protein